MNKEFIPYEQALELKELGFDEDCLASYRRGNLIGCGAILFDVDGLFNNGIVTLAAPLYQQAFRWLREKYDLNYVIVKAESWFYTINGCNTQEGFKTYEQAEQACLLKLIELVKQQ